MLSNKRTAYRRIAGVPAVFALIAGAIVALQATAAAFPDSAAGRAADVETYEGISVGLTSEGRPFRGNPDAALTLVEYTDYVCPYCAMYFQRTLPILLDKYVRTGQLKLVIEDLPLASLHPTAARGAAAALCVADQGAARFWQMHDVLFREQQQWGRLEDPSAFLAGAARKLGVDMVAYDKCIASRRHDARIQQGVAAAGAMGFTGTPTFQFVNARNGKAYTVVGAQPPEVFGEWIDTLLAGKEPLEVQPQGKPELPLWARPEGLAPDPKRPGLTVAGDRYMGNPKARLVVVEFEDFECASCQRHALTTQPMLDKRFVDTGDVLWVVKHLPLRMHSHAPAAAVAAECAGKQGKFWPMHHALFERMEQWSGARDVDAALVKIAKAVGIASKPFTACLSSRKALERVLQDIYDAQAIGVKTLPTFILLRDGTGHVLTGARSPEQFAGTLQQQLDGAKAQAPSSGAVARQ